MNENPEIPAEEIHVVEPVADPDLGPGVVAAPAPAEPPAAVVPRPSRSSWLWQEWIRPLLIVLTVMCVFRSALADWNDVPTGSMKPTIVEGDRIFVNKAAYDLRVPFTLHRLMGWGDPQRGDIVVLFSPDDEKRLVKRVIGIPGDTVEVRRGRLLINDERLSYEPLERTVAEDLAPAERFSHVFEKEGLGHDGHAVMLRPYDPGTHYGPIIVPPGNYFVMGDNRYASKDSRVFGFVERKRIVGQATLVLYSCQGCPLGLPLGPLRWGRFFHDLE